MPRNKQGAKTRRAEINRAFQAALRERKRLRKERRHAVEMLNQREISDMYREEEKACDDFAKTARRVIPPLRDAVLSATSAPHPDIVHADEVELFASTPTDEQWADMLAQAKKRKRSVVKMAEKSGWTLVDGDGKAQGDWSVT